MRTGPEPLNLGYAGAADSCHFAKVWGQDDRTFCIRYNGYVHRQVVYAIRVNDDRTFGKVKDLLEDAALTLTGSHAAADGNRRNAVEGAGNVGSRFDKAERRVNQVHGYDGINRLWNGGDHISCTAAQGGSGG